MVHIQGTASTILYPATGQTRTQIRVEAGGQGLAWVNEVGLVLRLDGQGSGLQETHDLARAPKDASGCIAVIIHTSDNEWLARGVHWPC